MPFNYPKKNKIGLGLYIFTIINRHLIREMLGEKVAIQVGIRSLPLLRSSRGSYPFLFEGGDALQKYNQGNVFTQSALCMIDELSCLTGDG
jgi:hypothetical protein